MKRGRLGDGFYEQKLVVDQILATTRQRFQEGLGDNDSQYKHLLANGSQFAVENGIKLGVAFTEAQQRQPDQHRPKHYRKRRRHFGRPRHDDHRRRQGRPVRHHRVGI